MKGLLQYLLISFTFLLLGHSGGNGEAQILFSGISILDKSSQLRLESEGELLHLLKVFNPVEFYIVLAHKIPMWCECNHSDEKV